MKNLPLGLRTQARCPKLKPGQLWIVFDTPERKQGTGLLVAILKNNDDGAVVVEAYTNKKRRISSADLQVEDGNFHAVLSVAKLYIKKKSPHNLPAKLFCKKEGGYCVGYIYKKILPQLEQNLE